MSHDCFHPESALIPVFFGHGFPFTSEMWKDVVARLLNDDYILNHYALIFPNFIGFGDIVKDAEDLSDVPAGSVTTMTDMADQIIRTADALYSSKFVYCGLSMGGYVGWEIWNRCPDRLLGLVVSDTNAKADSPEAAAKRLQTADRVEQEDSCAFLADAMKDKLFAPDSQERCPDALKTYYQMVSRNNPPGVAAAARGMAQRKDYTARLGEIQTPTLVIGGKNDVLSTPESLDALAAAMPNAVRATVPGGHLAPLEHPDEYAAAIADFLKTL